MSSFALVDVSKFIPHFLRVLQQSIYFTEKMIHVDVAFFESFTDSILSQFLKTEKGQSHELLCALCPFSGLLHYSVSSFISNKNNDSRFLHQDSMSADKLKNSLYHFLIGLYFHLIHYK